LFLTRNGLAVPIDVSAIRRDVRTIESPAAPLAPLSLPAASPPKPKTHSATTISPPASPALLPVLVAATADGSSTLSVVPHPSALAVAPSLAAAPAVAAGPLSALIVTPARFDADDLKTSAPPSPLT
jgi:hypothetical protein